MLTPVLFVFAVASEPPHIVRSGDLLPALAREANVTVEVPKRFSENRIYLDRRGASPMVALRAVVRSMNASLSPTKSGFKVSRSAVQTKAIQERLAVVRLGWLSRRLKAVEDYRKANRSTSGDDPLVAAYKRDVKDLENLTTGKSQGFPGTTASQLLPAAKLLEGLAERIGLASLAAIPNGEFRVYEDFPVSTAKPLPPHRDLDSEYVAAAERLIERGIPDAVAKEVPGGFREALVRPLPPRPADAIRFRLECVALENALYLTLEAYDRSGKRVDDARLVAGPCETMLPSQAMVREALLGRSPDWIDLAPSARAALGTLGRRIDALPSWFNDPVRSEPLNLFVRDGVAALVGKEDARCVAFDVDDGLWTSVKDCASEGRLSVQALRRTLTTYRPYERIEDKEAVVWRPLDPEIAAARRADRKVLVRFAAAVKRSGSAGVRDKARLFHDASPESGTLTTVWSSLARAATPPQTGGDFTDRVYSLLGGIADPDWERLLRGEAMTAGRLGLTRELKRLLEQPSGLSLVADRPISDIENHPLELYGGGLGETPVSLRQALSPVVKVWRNDKEEVPAWMPESALANLFSVSQSFRVQDGQVSLNYSRESFEQKRLAPFLFRRGTNSTVSLAVGLPRGLRLRGEGPGTVQNVSRPFAYADLSESERAANWDRAYREGLIEAKKRLGVSP